MGTTTDRNDGCLNIMRSDGQQECYLVLSEEERAKGFVRPVRYEYRHLKCGSVTTMNSSISETYARDPKFYGGTFCVECVNHFPLWITDDNHIQQPQFEWIDDRTPVGS